jgi:hypothetical protein
MNDETPKTNIEEYLQAAQKENARRMRLTGLPATGVDPSTIQWKETAGKKPLKRRLLKERGNTGEIDRG